MSTTRRQGRPEGAAGIWKSSGSWPGVHGDVDVAVDQVGPIATAGRRERRPAHGCRAEKSGRAGSTPCQRISGGCPPRSPVKKVRRRSTGWALPQGDHHPHEPEEVGVPLLQATSRPS